MTRDDLLTARSGEAVTKFDPVYNPTDTAGLLDIHDNPPGLWKRVAVVTLWQDSKIGRKRWPNAAVVGPLRTKAGIDLLVRNLLANPQIRVVIVDGPTAGVVGEQTLGALNGLWLRNFDVIGEDVPRDALRAMFDNPPESMVFRFMREELGDNPEQFVLDFVGEDDENRPAFACGTYPPPAPKASAPAPHGDPGERVAGDTLADVWPQALHRIMRFGREVPTQYGMTREVWNLVSVIRDPSLSDSMLRHAYREVYPAEGKQIPFNITNGEAYAVKHPVLGLTYAEVVRYYREALTGSVVPEGQSYGYGARMAGVADQLRCPACSGLAYPSQSYESMRAIYDALDEPIRACATAPWGYLCATKQSASIQRVRGEPFREDRRAHSDQFAAVKKLLTTSPDTRAAYLTPWQADLDAGKERGRPCLVGVMFRATPNTMSITPQQPKTLHMTVWFRSHDVGSAYALNLAGCCLWLVEWARELGMAVGTVTCMSSSAHIYDRDWKKAEEVIAAIKWPAIVWDQRSSWRIERVDGPDDVEAVCDYIEDYDVYDIREAGLPYSPCGALAVGGCYGTTRCAKHLRHIDERYRKPLPKKPILRATAFMSGPESDGKVIAVLEAESPGALKLAIERSGLVTGIGQAMWIGSEIERVWRS
jgi:thymidylate synthase